MIGGRAIVAGALAAVCLLGCNGQFRFDDHSVDAAADSARNDGRLEGGCGDANCGFLPLACLDDGCPFECPSRSSCQGRCGESCSADCESQSTCTLSAGGSSRLRCEQSSRCDFVAGAGSTLECWSDSTCRVRCRGGCQLECSASAHCELACGDEPHRPVTGLNSCP